LFRKIFSHFKLPFIGKKCDLLQKAAKLKEKDDDQEEDVEEEKEVLNRSSVILRVRRDSDDSLGSELSCSSSSDSEEGEASKR